MALDKSYGIALGWPLAPGQFQAAFDPNRPAIPINALLSAINGQPLFSARDGAILTSARN